MPSPTRSIPSFPWIQTSSLTLTRARPRPQQKCATSSRTRGRVCPLSCSQGCVLHPSTSIPRDSRSRACSVTPPFPGRLSHIWRNIISIHPLPFLRLTNEVRVPHAHVFTPSPTHSQPSHSRRSCAHAAPLSSHNLNRPAHSSYWWQARWIHR